MTELQLLVASHVTSQALPLVFVGTNMIVWGSE